jgi:hypothetical protein
MFTRRSLATAFPSVFTILVSAAMSHYFCWFSFFLLHSRQTYLLNVQFICTSNFGPNLPIYLASFKVNSLHSRNNHSGCSLLMYFIILSLTGSPYGGRLEYLHHSPASRTWWGNPVPRCITGSHCHWGRPGPPGWGLDAGLTTMLCKKKKKKKNEWSEIQRCENLINPGTTF